jgi:hypothetical protein
VSLLAVILWVEHTPTVPAHTFHTVGVKATNGQIPLDIIRVDIRWISSKDR